mmetsp:Transcript_34836/g.98766  ORF Transcript_34836/g.98766 Transcript_34836/m.98766 type:complete len:192 (+) Transcript_34836:260-835(+)
MSFWRQLRVDLGLYGRVAIDIVQYYCAVKLVSKYVVDLEICVGPSMMPTLDKDGALVVCEHLSTHFGGMKKGDIVVAHSPFDVRHSVCKRITGLPGDVVVQGPDGPDGQEKVTVVPAGHVWLQGDNLNNSRDSRLYGPVPMALVKGRVVYQLWPLEQHGPLASRPLPPAQPSRWGGRWFGPTDSSEGTRAS